jgi:hypothetical protein
LGPYEGVKWTFIRIASLANVEGCSLPSLTRPGMRVSFSKGQRPRGAIPLTVEPLPRAVERNGPLRRLRFFAKILAADAPSHAGTSPPRAGKALDANVPPKVQRRSVFRFVPRLTVVPSE